MLHIPPTNLLLLAAKQDPYKKSLSLNERYWRIFWKKFRRKGQQAENDKTERVTGLGRSTRDVMAKWNQMTALRFQTGGRHQTSPASLQGPHCEKCTSTYRSHEWIKWDNSQWTLRRYVSYDTVPDLAGCPSCDNVMHYIVHIGLFTSVNNRYLLLSNRLLKGILNQQFGLWMINFARRLKV